MKTRIPATLLKLALCTAACFSPAAQTSTLNYGFEDCRVATADELDGMRGGFDLNVGGLHLSFSIDRVTFINGKLVATTSLNIPSLNALLNMPSLNSLDNPQAIIANLQNAFGSSGSTGGGMTSTSSSGGSGTGNGGATDNTTASSGGSSTGTASSGGGGSGTGTAGGSTSSTGTGSGSTGTASSGGSTTGAGGSTTTAGTGSGSGTTGSAGSGSSGGGSTGTSPTAPGIGGGTTASAGTGSSYNASNAIQNGLQNTSTLLDGLNTLNSVIQNTLDNQVIRNMTILNATLNSQASVRAMTLNQMLKSSIR